MFFGRRLFCGILKYPPNVSYYVNDTTSSPYPSSPLSSTLFTALSNALNLSTLGADGGSLTGADADEIFGESA